MGFTVVPIGNSTPVDAFSLPNMCSFVVDDTGAGGQVNINGLGVTSALVSGAIDLKTYFGAAFRSLGLLNAFRAITPGGGNQAAELALVPRLEVVIYPVGAVGLAAMPAVNYLGGLPSGPDNVPYLTLNGPGVSGTWRVELKLRHSITD